jgi:type 1 glutamine amidotransferase
MGRATQGQGWRWGAALGCLGIVLLLLTNFPPDTSAEVSPARIKVLLVTGQDYPGHVWRETAPALRQLLEADRRYVVRLLEDPHALDSATLTNYQVVLLHFQNWQAPGPGAAARANLRQFIADGGGLMSVHFACGAWHGEWPEFQDILGRVWRGTNGPQHDRRGKFTVQIVAPQHPAVRGLTDFETDDELYTCLVGDAPIHLLAQAKSQVDQRNHPMAFARDFGKGRVFLTTLGHDVKAFTNSCVPQLLRQGCAWAAGIPAN